jgi:hypothetical protein
MEVLGGIGKDIAGGINNAIAGWANKAQEERELAEMKIELRQIHKKFTNTFVDFYCADDWDAIINFNEAIQGRAVALKIIAYAKKGNCEDALRKYLFIDLREMESDAFFPGDKVQFSEKTKKFFAETNLSSLAEEAIKQAYSKAKGHQVTDEEFKQIKISFCEKEISRIFTPYAIKSFVEFNEIEAWLKKWSNLQGITKYTGEDLKKIPGINEKMIKGWWKVKHFFTGEVSTGKSSKVAKKYAKIVKFLIFGTMAFFVIRFIIQFVIAILGEL